MSDILFGLLLTFVLGIFILLGAGIVFLTKNNDKFVNFSISVAFGVMTMLMLLELMPETIEHLNNNYLTFIVSLLSGIIILKLLDKIIPHHKHDFSSHEDHMHLNHIGMVSSVALFLHNIIEGMAVYSTSLSSRKLGLLVSIGVGLHNIPMGMVIASTYQKANNNVKKTIFVLLLVSLSTFLGGAFMGIFGNLINDKMIGILLAVTLGMLVYIVVLELLPQILHTKDKKTTIMGVFLGTILFLLTLFID